MKPKQKIFFGLFAMALAFSACTVLSFYPLYSEDVLIRDDRIVGTWLSVDNDKVFSGSSGDSLIWEISFPSEIKGAQSQKNLGKNDNKIPNTFTYFLKVYEPSDPDTQAGFNLHLVQLSNQVFVDFFPEDWEGNCNNTLLAIHLMGVHTFAKIDIGGLMQINWFDEEQLEKLIDENRIRVSHESNGANTLLTAKPAELQKFVIKYAGEPDAFSENLNYRLGRIAR